MAYLYFFVYHHEDPIFKSAVCIGHAEHFCGIIVMILSLKCDDVNGRSFSTTLRRHSGHSPREHADRTAVPYSRDFLCTLRLLKLLIKMT